MESFPVGNTIINIGTNKNYRKKLSFFINQEDLPNKEFSITDDGDLVLAKSLDYETETEYTFHVIVTDGVTRETTEVKISIINVNDWNPAFRYPSYEFFVAENNSINGYNIGQIEVSIIILSTFFDVHLNNDF